MAAELRSFPNPMYNSRLPGEMAALRPSSSRRDCPFPERDSPLKADGETGCLCEPLRPAFGETIHEETNHELCSDAPCLDVCFTGVQQRRWINIENR